MAYIVTEDYFVKELSIPNLYETRDVSGGTDTFEMYIDKESRELLTYVLGYTNFKDLDGYIDANGDLLPTAPVKWQNLVNGVEYTNDGTTYNWQGLIYTEGAFKGSVLAYYVYCKWLEFQVSQMTGVGEMKGDSVNSVMHNSTYRLTTLWNTFVTMYQGTYNSISSTYYKRGIRFTDYLRQDGSNNVSLIQFLQDNEDVYKDCNLGCFEVKNSFGI